MDSTNLHGPMNFWNPVKLLANVSAVAMIYGIWVLWTNRAKSESDSGTVR